MGRDMNNNNNTAGFSGRMQHQVGQAIFLVMALVLIISVTVFLVFNSGRTVNEKINLVNAADAAAYSGAQIAARQLNFMAYTNRAMIANEVAIGHMLSYQMEVDIISQSLAQIVDAFMSLFSWIPWIGGFFSAISDVADEFFAQVSHVSSMITGLYASAVDRNNAMYSSLQYEAFKDFAYPQEGTTLIEAAMKSVVRDYQVRDSAPILLNDSIVLNHFAINGEGAVQAAALAADDMHASFCRMMLFVRPDAIGTGNPGSGNEMQQFCQNLANGEGAETGGPASPMSDNGQILEMLRSTVSNFGNAEWIRDRDSRYRFLGFNIHRSGSTDVVYDMLSGQLNWVASDDRLRVGDPILNISLHNIRASGDVTTMSHGMADAIDDATFQAMVQTGICTLEPDDDPETLQCDELLTHRYGSIRRYAYLNPNAGTPTVTAFLAQQNCSDNIGIDSEGNKVEGWHDDLTHLERMRPFCTKTVYAVSQAQVFFQRPPCSGNRNGNNCEFGFTSRDAVGNFTEQANLFNPFWQVRLQAMDGGN